MCQEMTFGEYFSYWDSFTDLNHQDEPCLYLKDWHFVRDVCHGEPAGHNCYSTPPYFCSDWLNEWWYHRKDEHEKSDYRFVYIGPKGRWSNVFSCYFAYTYMLC